jgi:hypothetical protein
MSPRRESTETRSVVVFVATILVLSLPVLWIIFERKAAQKEYASYNRLCSMGATGDDWISFRELVTGKPPIVQLIIPAHIPEKMAFDALPDFQNLEALTIGYPSLNSGQLRIIRQLHLNALTFAGDYPGETNVQELAPLRDIRFLYIHTNNLSFDAQSKLQSLLPSTRIEFR